MSMGQYCCHNCELAIRDGEMVKNYARMGWVWPVARGAETVPRYCLTFCPYCFADLPPILDDAAVRRIMTELFPSPLWPLSARFPDWMRKRQPDWQADGGEGSED